MIAEQEQGETYTDVVAERDELRRQVRELQACLVIARAALDTAEETITSSGA